MRHRANGFNNPHALVSPERRFISALHRLESMSTRRDFLNLAVKGSQWLRRLLFYRRAYQPR